MNSLRPAFRFLVVALLLSAGPVSGLAQNATPVPTQFRSDHLVMQSTDEETKILATGNVVFTATNLRITCDQLTILAASLDEKDSAATELEKFKYVLATGDVHIVQGTRDATCQRAEIFPREDKIVLSEAPVVIDKATGIVGAGKRIILFRGRGEMQVEEPQFTAPPLGDLGPKAGPRSTSPRTP